MYGLYRLPVRTYFSDFVVHGVECITVQFPYVWHYQWLILSASRTQDSSVDRSTGTGFYRLPVRTYFSDFIVHGVECITVQFSYVWHNQWLILSASRTQDSSIDRSTGTGFYQLPVRTYFSDFILEIYQVCSSRQCHASLQLHGYPLQVWWIIR